MEKDKTRATASLNNFIDNVMPAADDEEFLFTDSDEDTSDSACSELLTPLNYLNPDLDDDENYEKAECLFCTYQDNDPDVVIMNHCKEDHQLSFREKIKDLEMDEMSCLKMVNYLRANYQKGSTGSEVLFSFEASRLPWDDDKLLIPVKQNDALLSYYWCELVSDARAEAPVEQVEEEPPSDTCNTVEKLEQMRGRLRTFFDEEAEPNEEDIAAKKRMIDDDAYFDTYDGIVIHREMLTDEVRTKTYQRAILDNLEDFEGKYVLDVGCGTGILSMFAAKAGATQVFAVDKSRIILDALEIIDENKLSHKVRIIPGNIENITLPVEKVDVIISEWMGYFLLYEGMLTSVVHARERFLKKGGLILPNRAQMKICGVDDPNLWYRNRGVWDDVYGFKMSCLKKRSQDIVIIKDVDAECVISSEATIHELDILTCTEEEAADGFDTPFTLAASRDGSITAIVGYFDCDFDACSAFKEKLQTGPQHKLTHWAQSSFFLNKPVEVKSGEVLHGQFEMRPAKDSHRVHDIRLEFAGQKMFFRMR